MLGAYARVHVHDSTPEYVLTLTIVRAPHARRWAAVNIPGVGKIELQKLLGDSTIRIVGYVVPKGVTKPRHEPPDRHSSHLASR